MVNLKLKFFTKYFKVFCVTCLMICLVLFFAYFIFFKSVQKGKAELAYFYPETCRGDWQDPDKAQGQPQLVLDSTPESFNAENSALYQGGQHQIFCNNFQGNQPENSTIKDARVKIIWSIASADVAIQAPALAETVSASTTVAEPVLETNASSSVDSISSPEAVIPDSTTTSPEVVTTITESGENQTSVVTKNPDNFILKYSFDGVTWDTLAYITRDNWQKDFLLPLKEFSDLSNLQLSLETVQADVLAPVYLDGFVLEVNYEDQVDKPKPDFAASNILKVQSSEEYSVVFLENTNSKVNSLWLYDRRDLSWQEIVKDESIAKDSPIIISGHDIFWLSSDKNAITGYSIDPQIFFGQSLDESGNAKVPFGADGLFIRSRAGVLDIVDVNDNKIDISDNQAASDEIRLNFDRNIIRDQVIDKPNLAIPNENTENLVTTTVTSTNSNANELSPNNEKNIEEVNMVNSEDKSVIQPEANNSSASQPSTSEPAATEQPAAPVEQTAPATESAPSNSE